MWWSEMAARSGVTVVEVGGGELRLCFESRANALFRDWTHGR